MKRNLFIRMVALFLVPCMAMGSVGADLVSARHVPVRHWNAGRTQGSPLQFFFTSQALEQSSLFVHPAREPAGRVDEQLGAAWHPSAVTDNERSLEGGRWPWMRTVYKRMGQTAARVTGFMGSRASKQIGRVSEQFFAPLVVESGVAAYVFLKGWSLIGQSPTWFVIGVFILVTAWQALHIPGARPGSWKRKFVLAFTGERRAISVVTLFMVPVLMSFLRVHNPVVAIWGVFNITHGLVMVLWRPMLRLLEKVMQWWHWRRVVTLEEYQESVDWTCEQGILQYGMDTKPEFLLPRVSLWRSNKDLPSDAVEIVLDLAAEVWHVPFSFIWEWLAKLAYARARKAWFRSRERAMEEGRAGARLDHHQQRVRRAKTLENRRHLFRNDYKINGYLWADYVMKQFAETPYDEKTASSGDLVGEREQLIQMLEGYFEGVMKVKEGNISDFKDAAILKFLNSCLADSDPWVVKAAIRAIGVNGDRLTEGDKKHLLETYWHMLGRHESEIVRAAVARDLSQEMASFNNIEVARLALESGRQKPWVQVYLAETLEYLLKAYRYDLSARPQELRKLAWTLSRKAADVNSIIGIRVNAIRALGRLPSADIAVLGMDILDHLAGLLEKDLDPSVQAAALWALLRLAPMADRERQVAAFYRVNAFVNGHHAGRRNLMQERFGVTVMRHWADRLGSPPLKALAEGWVTSNGADKENPVLFIDVEPLVGHNASDAALCLTAEPVSALLRELHKVNMSVVITHGFREDRDRATFREPRRPAIQLLTDRLATVLDKLHQGLPALIPSRDPVRGKHANRLARHVVPQLEGPIIILGRSSDVTSIMKVWGKAMYTLSLADHPELALEPPVYLLLISAILKKITEPVEMFDENQVRHAA